MLDSSHPTCFFLGAKGLGNRSWDLVKPVLVAGTMVELTETTLAVPTPGGGSKGGSGSALGSCPAPPQVNLYMQPRKILGTGMHSSRGSIQIALGTLHRHSEQ